jgi:predicted dehydrogenase
MAYPQDTLALYIRQIEASNRAIQQHEEPLASGIDGLRAVEVTEAMIESASQGSTVKLEPLVV